MSVRNRPVSVVQSRQHQCPVLTEGAVGVTGCDYSARGLNIPSFSLALPVQYSQLRDIILAKAPIQGGTAHRNQMLKAPRRPCDRYLPSVPWR